MNKTSMIVSSLLLVLGMQAHAQDARGVLRPEAAAKAQPEELQAMQQKEPAAKAVGGGLECKDAFIDLNIALGQRRARDVFCPAGTVAVSGGATATINTGLYINASGPTSGLDIDSNKWFTSVENYSSPTNGIGPSVRFYARCCRVVP